MPHDDDDDRGSFGGGFTGGSFGDSTESDDIGGGGGDDSGGDSDSGDDDPGGASSGGGGFGRSPSNPVGSTPSGGGGSSDDDDDDDDGGRNPSGGPTDPSPDPSDDDPSQGTDEPSGRTPGGGPSPGAGGAPEDDNPAIGGDPTDDPPAPGEPGGTPDDFGDDDGTDTGPSQQEQRQNQIDDAVQDVIENSPFVDTASDVATEFTDGNVQTELTGTAAELREEAQSLIDTSPAADAISDLNIGNDVSVRQSVQRSFERQQTVSQTVSESRFADEPDDVDVTFEDGDAVAELTGDAARAQQRANRLLASNPAADELSDIAIEDGDAEVRDTAQREFVREQTVQETVEQSPFADEPDDVATTVTEDGDDDFDAVAQLTGDAARAQQAVQQTLESSPFADEVSEVAADVRESDVETELRGAAAQAREEAQELIESNPAADALADVAIGEGDASVEQEAEREFERQQRDRLRDLVFSQPDSASIAPIDDPPARETETDTQTQTETDTDTDTETDTDTQTDSLEAQLGLQTDAAAAEANREVAAVREQRQEVRQQRQETRAAVNRFGQQQLAVGIRRDENELAADVVSGTDETLRADTQRPPFGSGPVARIAGAEATVGTIPTDEIISGVASADSDEELVESATSGGLFAETDARGGDLESVLDPNDAPDGSVATGVTGISEQDLARDTGISAGLADFIENAGETPVEEGGRPPSEERFGEQVVEGTATAASAFINPEFFGRQIERTAEVADPDTLSQIADDPGTAAETAVSEIGATAVESGEQFSRDPGTAVGGAAFTALTAGAASAAAGRRPLSGRTARDAVSAELDPRIGPFGTTIETTVLRQLDPRQRVVERTDAPPTRDRDGGDDGAGDDETVTLSADDIAARQLGGPEVTQDLDSSREDIDAADPVQRRREQAQRDDAGREMTTGRLGDERPATGDPRAERSNIDFSNLGPFDSDLDTETRTDADADADARSPEVTPDADTQTRTPDGETRRRAVPEQVFGTVAGLSVVGEAEERRQQAQSILPGLRDATDPTTATTTGAVTDVFDDTATGTTVDAVLNNESETLTETVTGVQSGIDSNVDLGSDSLLGVDTDTDTRQDIRQDPVLRDEQLQDPDVRDRDRDIRDPDFVDPDLRDFDPETPLEDDDEDEERVIFGEGAVDDTFSSGIESAEQVLGSGDETTSTTESLEEQLGL